LREVVILQFSEESWAQRRLLGTPVVIMNHQHSENNSGKLALSRVEAANALGISPISIDRLVKRGLLYPSRATRRPLFPTWELERFLRETSQKIKL
jgi:hypothetical protein